MPTRADVEQGLPADAPGAEVLPLRSRRLGARGTILKGLTSPSLGLGPTERQVHACLWSHARLDDPTVLTDSECFPSWPTLAARAGISVRRVAKAIKLLQERGLISLRRQGRRIVYTLHARPMLEAAGAWQRTSTRPQAKPMQTVHGSEPQPMHAVHGLSGTTPPVDPGNPSTESLHRVHVTHARRAPEVVQEVGQEVEPPSTASPSFPPHEGGTAAICTSAGVVWATASKVPLDPRPSFRRAAGPRTYEELMAVAASGTCPYCDGPNPEKKLPCDACGWHHTRQPIPWEERCGTTEVAGTEGVAAGGRAGV